MGWQDWLNKWRPKPKPPNPRPPHRPPIHTTTTTTTTTTTRPPSPSGGPTDLDMRLFQAHNEELLLNNKSPRSWDNQLYQAARAHSAYMASVEQMAHKDIGDGDPWQRIRSTGYRFQTASENIAAGYRSVEAVMTGWMNSSGHRINILGNTTEMGCSMVISTRGTWYWTTVFATPATILIAGMSQEDIMSIDSVTSHSQEEECETSSIHIRGEDEEPEEL